jgi:hypothetical protein
MGVLQDVSWLGRCLLFLWIHDWSSILLTKTESMLSKLEKVPPMKMVLVASVTQVVVLGIVLIGIKLLYIITY